MIFHAFSARLKPCPPARLALCPPDRCELWEMAAKAASTEGRAFSANREGVLW